MTNHRGTPISIIDNANNCVGLETYIVDDFKGDLKLYKNGVRVGELVVFCAGKSVGKSVFNGNMEEI